MTAELRQIHQELKIGQRHLAECKLPVCAQPELSDLEVVDIDSAGRPFILLKSAAVAWRKMRQAAIGDGVLLQPFSGFRSYVYQKQLILNKLAQGRSLEVIFTETAIPGYSEHHTGRAVDICTDGDYRLDQNFETTRAFAWLVENAGRFEFSLSYPRDNAYGIIYEPWHWYYSGA